MPSRRRKVQKPAFPYVLNAASPQAQGLTGWWPGDPSGGGKLFDLSGRGRHGTSQSSTAYPGIYPGGVDGGNQIVFDGTVAATARYVIPSLTTIAGSVSFVFWIRPNSPTRSYGTIIDNAATNGGIWLRNTRIMTKYGSGTNIGSPLPDLTWSHVVVTEDGTNSRLYINGVLNATAANTATPQILVNIGGDAGSESLKASLDGLSIYNRPLSAVEVWSLYDPATRWSLRYQVGKTRYFLPVPTTLVTFEAAANSGYTAATTSFSGSATWRRDNRLLAVDVSMFGPGVTVSAMTYGGATCTLIGSQSTVTSFGRVEQWIIKQSDSSSPGTGANTLAVTLSGSVAFAVNWVAYSGVHQSTPTEAFSSSQATNIGATDATVTITTVAANDWIHAAIATNDTSVTANQTSRNNVTGALGSGADEDTGPIASPGANAVSYTGVGALATWAIAGYALRPTTAVALNVTATGDLQSLNTTIVGVGDYTSPNVTATGSLLVNDTTIIGVGVYGTPAKSGTGDLQTVIVTIAGVGTVTPVPISGTGDLQILHATVVGVGDYDTPTKTGTGALATNAVTTTGVGMIDIVGTGSLTATAAFIGNDTASGGIGLNIPIGGLQTNGPGNRYGAPGVHHRRPSRKV